MFYTLKVDADMFIAACTTNSSWEPELFRFFKEMNFVKDLMFLVQIVRGRNMPFNMPEKV
jgi:hypothetical protein